MNDELVVHLKEAIATLDAAGVPSELRQVAFAPTFEFIVRGMRSGAPGVTAEAQTPHRATATVSSADPSMSQRFVAIAKELELDTELVERLFDEHSDGDLQFVGTLQRFGTAKQAMVDGVAVLLCAATRAGGYDSDGRTSDAVIRREVERHGLYDVTNYSKHTKQLRQLANVNGS